jgi:hypothetical protein
MSQFSELSANLRGDENSSPARRVDPQAVPYRAVGLVVGCIDIIVITLTCIVANKVYKLATLGNGGDIEPIFGIGLYSAIFFVLLMKARGLYSAHALASLPQQLRGGTVCWFMVLLGLLSLFFLLKVSADFSRGATVLFGVGGGIILAGIRAIVAGEVTESLARGTLEGRRAILIGASEEITVSSGASMLQRYGVTEVEHFLLPGESGLANELDVETLDSAMQFQTESNWSYCWCDGKTRRA